MLHSLQVVRVEWANLSIKQKEKNKRKQKQKKLFKKVSYSTGPDGYMRGYWGVQPQAVRGRLVVLGLLSALRYPNRENCLLHLS